MNRSEFIQTIMELYPRVFNKEKPVQYQGWIDRYKNSIGKNWNFEKLMWLFETKWTSVIEPPPPSFFYKFKEDVRLPKQEEKVKLTKEEEQENLENFKLFKENLKVLYNMKSLE